MGATRSCLAVLILLLFLAACSSQSEPTSDLRSLIAEAVSEAIPTATPTAMPTPSVAQMVADAKRGVVRIETNSSNGSGFIFETTGQGKAHILTNQHVIAGDQFANVLVEDAQQYNGKVLGYDSQKDLAVVEICCGRFRFLEYQDRAKNLTGEEVIAVGYPLGLSGAATVTRGIISAVRWDSGRDAWMIQTDAPINPGNSGGPLLLADVRVIGVNTSSIDSSRDGRSVDGIGFAVSWKTIQNELPDLKQGKRVGPPPTPTPTRVRWQRWRHPDYSYEINVPVSWSIRVSESDSVHFDSPDLQAGVFVQIIDWHIVSPRRNWIDG